MTPTGVPVYKRIRFVPTLAALIVVCAGIALGQWQQHRASEKRALQATLEARRNETPAELNALNEQEFAQPELKYRRAIATGQYLAEGQIYIDNRSLGDEIGYYVLTPLKLESGLILIVNRGFLRKESTLRQPPEVSVSGNRVRVEGVLSPGKTRFLELSADTVQGKIWQNFKPLEYSKVTGFNVSPWVLNLAPPDPGLKAVVEQPDLGIDTHRGYAFQWYALSTAAAVLYIYFTFLKKSSSQT